MITDDPGLHLVESWDEAVEFKRWLGERRTVLAVDTETDGLNWWNGQLRLVQFGDAMNGWVIPFQDWAGLVRECLRDYEGDIVFHNAKFDLHWLQSHGVEVKRHLVHDTMAMARLLWPLERAGLKETATRVLDHRAAHGQDRLKKAMGKAKWTWGSIPVEFYDYWAYAALDVVLTSRLYEEMWPRVQVDYRTIYDIEMRVLHILSDLETRGARVDLDYCAAKKAELEQYAEDARAWVRESYGFEAGQNKLVAAQLLKDGVKLTERTPSGEWKMDQDVLSVIQHPLAQTVLKVRKAEKLAHSYFGNFQELADGDIIHPDVSPMGAKTGRMSIGRPSMQNAPRGRLVRDAFIAREGHVLVGADLEQIEMRLTAHFSEDPDLIAAFCSGEDFFTAMARRIYNDDSITKDDPRRQVTKSSMYAKVYGSGIPKFAATAGIPIEDARTFMANLDAAFPGMRRMSSRVQNEARHRLDTEGQAYVRTPAGRRLAVEEANKIYKLVNALIQGTAADIFKQMIVELDDVGVTEFFILPVHDELVLDVPIDQADEAERELVRVMTRDEFSVPVVASANRGRRYGDLK